MDEITCARCGNPIGTSNLAGNCPRCDWKAGAPYTSGPARLGVLRHIHFRRVWSASLISNTGNWMEMLGVQMIVAHETGELSKMGYLAAAQLAPIMLLGVFGGLVADRVNRKALLIVTQVLLMLVAVSLAVVCAIGQAHYSVLLVISAVQGTVMAFNAPAWQVMTPRLVPKAELAKAITLQGIQFNAARVLGPAVGGLLMSQWGATPLFVVNAITFMGVLTAVIFTPNAPAPVQNGTRAWMLIREALAFIFKNKGPLCVFIATVCMSFLAAPLVRMLPLYIIDVYGLTESAADSAAGWFLACQGAGAVIGGLALRFIPVWYPKHHFIPMAITGAGVTISLFALTTSPGIGYGAMFIVGFFWIWAFNQSWAAMQQLVPDRMRGRVMSIATVASFGVTAIGNVAAGSLGDFVSHATQDKALGAHMSIGVLSGFLLLTGIVMLIWRVPEVDGMPSFAGPRSWNLFHAILASEHRPDGKRPPSVLDDPTRTIEEREPT